jgi:hypothetical protein
MVPGRAHIESHKGKGETVDRSRLEGNMNNQPIRPLIDFFKNIKDLRIERNKRYLLIEVIGITLLTVMASGEEWENIKKYGQAKEAWVKKFLPLEQSIPKHDVYRRAITRFKREAIASCFMAWVRVIKRILTGGRGLKVQRY